MEELGSQVAIGYLTSFILNWLKHQKWFPFMNVNTAQLNRAFSAFIAILVGLGISYQFDATTRILAIHIPNGMELFNSLMHIAVQFAAQDATYRTIVQPRAETRVTVDPGGTEIKKVTEGQG